MAGFSLNCGVSCLAHQRDRLERLCRYMTHPALCLERLSTNVAGQVVYQLKNPFRDGTTYILFSPEDFIARLAALVPRPRLNLTRYHRVFAPNSPVRRAIVPAPARARRRKSKDSAHAQATRQQNAAEPSADLTDARTALLTWAQRLKRVSEMDITRCPLCGGQLRVIVDITDPDLIRKIVDHVNSAHPRACRLSVPSPTRPHPIYSPNAERHAATRPPALTIPGLPKTPFPASGKDLFQRERLTRFFRASH